MSFWGAGGRADGEGGDALFLNSWGIYFRVSSGENDCEQNGNSFSPACECFSEIEELYFSCKSVILVGR